LTRNTNMNLTVKEAAQALGVTPHRVRELIASGKLRARHHATAYYWLISTKSIEHYIATGRPRTGRPRAVDTRTARAS